MSPTALGVDDWDTFIGILMLLEQLGESLQEQEEKTHGLREAFIQVASCIGNGVRPFCPHLGIQWLYVASARA